MHLGRADSRTLILDLDGTLFDPTTIPREVLDPLFDELRRASPAEWGAVERRVDAAFEAIIHRPLLEVAEAFIWPRAFRDRAIRAAERLQLPETLPLMPDAGWLEAVDTPKVLVTTGVAAIQTQKVAACGILEWIDEVHVLDGTIPTSRSKRTAFANILDRHGGNPDSFLVVGDRAESEIAAGRSLGFATYHVAREGLAHACAATWCRRDLWDLAILFGHTPT
ncbi:MAG: hypothetical protein RH859_12610 [Longimicrobiales bacterium]